MIMAMAVEAKQQVISEHRRHEGDVGSPEVQVAILTSRIAEITEHLKANKHDYASRRGLVMMVGKRSRLLRYLAKKDRGAYQALIQKLGLRR